MSIEEIRRCFPALARIHNGYPVAYFDGPGGTQVPRTVVEAMNDYLYHHNANTHLFIPPARRPTRLSITARSVLWLIFHKRTAPTETQLLARQTRFAAGNFFTWRARSVAALSATTRFWSELDHHANIAPWRACEKNAGVKVRMVKMIPETGELDWEDFSRQINRTHEAGGDGRGINTLGTINDVRRAAKMAHSCQARKSSSMLSITLRTG